MRLILLMICLALDAPASAQQPVPAAAATDEYVPPSPATHAPDGTIYCDSLPKDPVPPAAAQSRPIVCAPRLAQVILGTPTFGSPWQVQILSTFAYTPETVAFDNTLRQGKAYLAQKPGWERTHRCGGVLIDYDLVLTAAHCVMPKPNGDVRKTRTVRVGANNLATGQGATVGIRQVVAHAGYDPVTAINDIALLRLNWGRPTPLYPTIPLAGPGQPDATPGRRVAVTGWGLTSARDPETDPALTREGVVNHASAQLQELWLSVQPSEACRRVPELSAASGPGTICAVAEKDDADSCQGDSGGPLALSYLSITGPKTILVGVVSQGVGCAWRGTPALYTRVSAYRNWIERAKAISGRAFTLLP
jgi:hypothetical protein